MANSRRTFIDAETPVVNLCATIGQDEKLVTPRYDKLRRSAIKHVRREIADQALQLTALLTEAYLLLRSRPVIRQISVKHARTRASQKRGEGKVNV
jgi:hypothetical protein